MSVAQLKKRQRELTDAVQVWFAQARPKKPATGYSIDMWYAPLLDEAHEQRERVCAAARAVVEAAAALQGARQGSCAWREHDAAAIGWLTEAARSMQAMAEIDEGIGFEAAAIEHGKVHEFVKAAYDASIRAQDLFQQLEQRDISKALQQQAAALEQARTR